ncbi:hypothetical protein [Chitinophaga sp. CF418]|uniref:hypothetical protein n=1 Tax=Chitinophaga sp. CF418 TaxID=1855287 RepID=UPI00091EB346|nr:hypothetical protein [Chitinophaga sp. CF418]SHN23984.1 hypothetical protein SAMN05216311_107215 [Chitinophaga sp. CF418]
MKQTFLTAGLLILSIASFAQDADNDEYELKGNEQQGYIITKDDQKIEGIVKLYGKASNPWVNQKKVKFLAKESIDPSKKRQKFKVFDADDMKEYVAIEDSVERHFRLIKFTNKREGLTSGGGLGAQIKTIKNLASTTHMAEVIVDGPITMYRLYGYPSPVAVGNGDVAEAEAAEQNLRENPDILFQKGTDKPKELASSDIKKLVSDCQTVADKLAAGGYSTYDPAKEEKKKSAMGKLIKGELDRGGDKLLNMGTEIFGDYNKTCK